jgi:ribonuclease-3
LESERKNIFSKLLNPFHGKTYARLKRLLGFTPSIASISLYRQAFRHTSAASRIGDPTVNISNERLEFLGDAILDAIIADFLFRKFALKGEGFLTEMRSKIVSRDQLNSLAEKMGLAEMLEINGNFDLQHHTKVSLAGNALESLIGAIYLDKGFNTTRKFVVNKLLKPFVDMDDLEIRNDNYKSILFQYAQRNRNKVEFLLVEENGRSHQKTFAVAVMIDEIEIARASQFTKKKAEQMSARKACEVLKLLG